MTQIRTPLKYFIAVMNIKNACNVVMHQAFQITPLSSFGVVRQVETSLRCYSETNYIAGVFLPRVN